jgi:galactofuranose transport system permease protein
MGGIKGALGRITKATVFWPIVILLLMFAIAGIFVPDFFSLAVRDGHLFGRLIDILNRSTHIMVIAVGLTLVIATGGIDISVGSVVAISGAVAASLIGGKLVINGDQQTFVTSYPMWLAILAALGAACLAGLWNGVLITKLKMQPIVATLILLVAGRGIAQLITNGQIITIYYAPYFFWGNGFLLGLPFTIFLVGGVAFITYLVTRKTAFGLFIEAVGINPTASRYSGINADDIKMLLYVFSGLCAGISGILVSSEIKCADGNNAGFLFELDAILAVVIGGTSMNGGRFTILGSIIGALILQALRTIILAFGVPSEVIPLVKSVVVVVICFLQSEQLRNLIHTRARAAI